MTTTALSKAMALFLATAFLASCAEEQAKPVPSVPVVTGQTSSEDVPVYRTYPGKTVAVRTMGVHARVEGILEKLHFLQGGLVTPGQVLYSIQDEPFRAERDAAIGELASAVAEEAYAQSQLERNTKLVQEGAVSREYYEDIRSKHVKAEAMVETAKAKLVEAELNLEYCSVMVPDVPGENLYRAGQTYFDEGSLVGPGANSELATVVQISPIRAVFDPAGAEWPEYLKQSRGGQVPLTVEVTIPTDPDYKRTGRVNFVDNVVDSHTSTVEMWAEIENDQLELMPGQFISVKVRLQVLENAVVIPASAVQTSASKQFVWTLKDDKTPEQIAITLGPQHEDKIVVTSGLTSGETIIIDGGNKIRPGATIQVVSADQMKQMNQPAAGQSGGGANGSKAGS
ncbi:MAG: efflux RND transporter periplasmic adaptor subunit [Phycisphaerales bacterium]|nr:efflux RND transporter periplasmic adaptor subunit [Phycisphaerales bacterium]